MQKGRKLSYPLVRAGSLLLLLSLALSNNGSYLTVAARIATPDEHGPVTAIVLDSSGSGWFATGDATGTGYLNLMSLKDGKPYPGLSHGDPANRDKGITQMAMTAVGDDGWAIGVDDAKGSPLLWRLQGGGWRSSPHNLAPTTKLTDVALSANGHDGWMVGRDRKTSRSVLMRMRNGSWTPVTAPTGGILERVAISADGGIGWGVGYRLNSQAPLIFRLRGGRWSVAPANPFPKGQVGKLVTADDLGNGWMVAGPIGNRIGPDTLIRLSRDGNARVVPVTPPPTGFTPEPPLVLSALDVNRWGDGWVVGSLHLYTVGEREVGPPQQYYQPVPIRLRGESAAVVPPEAAGMFFDGYGSDRPNVYPTELTIGPDGVQALLGGIRGYGNGIMYHLHEPWPYQTPPSAPTIPGVGRCFDAASWCLRGVFARYWEQNGGLERFGYPVTPEVQETIHFRDGNDFKSETFTVQYTERARLEYNCRQGPCTVTLGHLGWDAEAQMRSGRTPKVQDYSSWFQPATRNSSSGWHWFPQTQHSVGPPFLSFWQNYGGVSIYGYPISEPFDEKNPDGKTYKVQYFERNRLEYHPEYKGTRNEIVPGLLGLQVFRSKYGFTP